MSYFPYHGNNPHSYSMGKISFCLFSNDMWVNHIT